MNITWQFPGTSSEKQSKLNAKTDAKYPMYKHQLCPTEFVLILNAKESSTFLVKNGSRVLQDGSRGTTVLDPSRRLLEEYGTSLIPGSNPSENPVKNLLTKVWSEWQFSSNCNCLILTGVEVSGRLCH